MKNESIVKCVLLAASAYNLGFAAYALADADSLLSLLDLPISKHAESWVHTLQIPVIFMGLLYLGSYLFEAGYFQVLFIGLITKFVPPVSGALFTASGVSVPVLGTTKFLMLSGINDVIWWYPMLWALSACASPSASHGKPAIGAVMRTAFESPLLSAVSSIAVTVMLGVLSCLVSVHWFSQYGVALFVVVPFLFGLFSALLHALVKPRSLMQCIAVSELSIGIACLCLLLIAAEGFICIVMAVPLLFFAGVLGGGLGYVIQESFFSKSRTFLMSLVLVNPLLFHIEGTQTTPNRELVTTTMVVRADVSTIWRILQEPIELQDHTHTLERIGFSVPRSASLIQRDAGAVLRCVFRDNVIDFPVEHLVPNEELSFLPMENTPMPMKELSVYDHVDAPHLHGYFTVERGTIALRPSSDGTTLLEARTQFIHRIAPSAYWNTWTGFIIDHLHSEVLSAIKARSEKKGV